MKLKPTPLFHNRADINAANVTSVLKPPNFYVNTLVIPIRMTAFLTSAMFVAKALWICLLKKNMLNNIKRNKSSSAVTAEEALLTCRPLIFIAAVAPTVKQGFNAIRAERASVETIRFEITIPSILKKSSSVVNFVARNIRKEQLLKDTKEYINQIIMMTRSSVSAVSVTSVANISVMQLLLRSIKEFTLVRSPTNVDTADNVSHRAQLLLDICELIITSKRNLSSVLIVGNALHESQTFTYIREFIPARSLINVLSVKSAFDLVLPLLNTDRFTALTR